MIFLDDFKSLFKRLTPLQAIAAELAEAEMELLKSETLREYAESRVGYNKSRIKRLKSYMAIEEKT